MSRPNSETQPSNDLTTHTCKRVGMIKDLQWHMYAKRARNLTPSVPARASLKYDHLPAKGECTAEYRHSLFADVLCGSNVVQMLCTVVTKTSTRR